jgi:hypothetical protein
MNSWAVDTNAFRPAFRAGGRKSFSHKGKYFGKEHERNMFLMLSHNAKHISVKDEW